MITSTTSERKKAGLIKFRGGVMIKGDISEYQPFSPEYLQDVRNKINRTARNARFDSMCRNLADYDRDRLEELHEKLHEVLGGAQWQS